MVALKSFLSSAGPNTLVIAVQVAKQKIILLPPILSALQTACENLPARMSHCQHHAWLHDGIGPSFACTRHQSTGCP